MIASKSRRSVLHPIVAIRFFLNLEGYSVAVVLRFIGFGPQSPTRPDFALHFMQALMSLGALPLSRSAAADGHMVGDAPVGFFPTSKTPCRPLVRPAPRGNACTSARNRRDKAHSG